MKRFFIFLLISILALYSCEPETYLFIDESPISFSESGGRTVLNIVANKDWTVVSSASWCSVSPSSGEGESTGSKITIDCSANSDYDDRSCMLTIVCAELAKSVTITQSQNKALIVSQKEYSLDENGGTISVEIQTNLSYEYEVTEGSSWISEISTKGLSSQTRKFEIKPNDSYDNRSGKIRFFNTTSGLSEEVVIRQSEKKELVIEKTQYELTYESQLLNIAVLTNMDYDVKINSDCVDWIHKTETKGLETESIILQISENEKGPREGIVYVTSASGIITLIISQEDGTINNLIPDRAFLEYCIREFDTNHDNLLSYSEAQKVRTINVDTDFISSMEGIQFFVNIESLTCRSLSSWGWNVDYNFEGIKGKLTSLDVSHNTSLSFLDCSCNHIKSLDLSNNGLLEIVDCGYNYLEYLNVSNCSLLQSLNCDCGLLDYLDISNCIELDGLNCASNQLTSLDVSNNEKLRLLRCDRNKLTMINVSNNRLLEGLYCVFNNLSQLDISQNTTLIRLDCSKNQLPTLDVSKNTLLTYLNCCDNQLTTLDVTKNTALTSLDCYNVTMTDLYLSIGQSFEYQNWYEGTTVHYK